MATVYLAEDLKHHARSPQGAPARARRRARRRPLPPRDRDRRPAPASAHPAAARLGRGRRASSTTSCRYVDGESLRERLAREGELPVARGRPAPARDRRRPGARPRRGRRPPRHQARQRAALRAPRAGDGLRRRQGGERGDRPAASSPPPAWPSARRPTWRPSRPPPIRTSTIGSTSTPSACWPTSCSPAGRRSRPRRRSRCSPRT